MKRNAFCRVLFFFSLYQASTSVTAQISSPGLGDINAASWLAVGFRQDLDSLGKIQSFTYLGSGRTSTPVNYNFLNRQAIFVLNQEFYFKFRPCWQYSLAMSYRSQNEYQKVEPYDKADPDHRQELRLYGRYAYVLSRSRLKLTLTLRQELRKFYTPGFQTWNKSTELRTRFRAQLTGYLTADKVQRLTGGIEPFFLTDHVPSNKEKWTSFNYSECRLTLFYSFAPAGRHLIYSIGYMDDLLGPPRHVHSGQYLTFDITIMNPFRKK